jgi:hypothetical protein
MNSYIYPKSPTGWIDPLGLQKASHSGREGGSQTACKMGCHHGEPSDAKPAPEKEIEDVFQSTIDSLEAEGKRFPANGRVAALANNFFSKDGFTSTHDFLFGDNGKDYGLGPYERCYDQADRLLANLQKNENLSGKWDFYIAESPGHYWVQGESIGLKNPVQVKLDPWLGGGGKYRYK